MEFDILKNYSTKIQKKKNTEKQSFFRQPRGRLKFFDRLFYFIFYFFFIFNIYRLLSIFKPTKNVRWKKRKEKKRQEI